jgi:hypothetical protein
MDMPATDITRDPSRRAWFREAVDLLGGGRAAARGLGITEASMRKLLSDGPNSRGIRDSIVAEMRKLLLRHSAECIGKARAMIAEQD